MPGKEKRWQYGDYWLSQRSGSQNYYVTWYEKSEAKGRRTNRRSLRTTDFEDAKIKLTSWVNEKGALAKQSSHDVSIATCVERYVQQKARFIVSKKTKSATRSILTQCVMRVGHLKVADFNMAAQQKFVNSLKVDGYKAGSRRRYLTCLFTALNWAFKNEEIDRVPASLSLPDSPPSEYVASIEELAKFWDQPKPFYLQFFFVMALATGGRPQAVTELTRDRCDLTKRLIDLNNPELEVTKKRRAIVPMADCVIPWVEECESGPLITSNGFEPIQDIFAPWRKYRRLAGLSERFTPHSIRHTVASEMRRRGVPKWDVEGYGGWRSAGGQTAERYAKYDANYLKEAKEAVESLINEVANQTESGLNPKDASQLRARDKRKWWAYVGSNYGPLPCQGSALPLSYTPEIAKRWR